VVSQPVVFSPPTTPVTIEALRRVVMGKKLRIADIASKVGSTPDQIRPLLTEANGFLTGDRGWISIKTEDTP
jgi:hypothetical protein